MPERTFNACTICAHEIKSPQCHHPWHLSFSDWPKPMLDQIKRMVPNGLDVENGGK